MDTRHRLVELLRGWSDGPKILVCHTDSPLDIAEMAAFIGSTEEIIEWSKKYAGGGATIYVAGPEKIVYGIRQILPTASIEHFDYETESI